MFSFLQAEKEKEEAEQMQKEMGLGDEDDSLAKMIKVIVFFLLIS